MSTLAAGRRTSGEERTQDHRAEEKQGMSVTSQMESNRQLILKQSILIEAIDETFILH